MGLLNVGLTVEVTQEHRTSRIETTVLDPETLGRQIRASRLSPIFAVRAIGIQLGGEIQIPELCLNSHDVLSRRLSWSQTSPPSRAHVHFDLGLIFANKEGRAAPVKGV